MPPPPAVSGPYPILLATTAGCRVADSFTIRPAGRAALRLTGVTAGEAAALCALPSAAPAPAPATAPKSDPT